MRQPTSNTRKIVLWQQIHQTVAYSQTALRVYKRLSCLLLQCALMALGKYQTVSCHYNLRSVHTVMTERTD